MLKSLVRKKLKPLLNPLVKKEDTLAPGESRWIDHSSNYIITNLNDFIIFKE